MDQITLSPRPGALRLVGIALFALLLAALSPGVASARGPGHGQGRAPDHGQGADHGRGLAASGAVFTATNDADANAVVVFRRSARGHLRFLDVVPTGGAGSGGGLGNQRGLVLDRSGRHLLAVNAGSDSLSLFGVTPRGLRLLDVADAGGVQPISVTVDGDLVYVLNAGDGGSISGFTLGEDGSLTPLAGSTRPLSGTATGPAQIAFTPDGEHLVVTEKATSTIVTYAIGDDGLPGDPVVTPAEGVTPFGFDFGHRSRLLVSEATGGDAGASTVSSYAIEPDGTLQPITSALATGQSAACWLVATGNGRFAYTTNTGSDTVTGLSVGRDGSLALLSEDGVTAAAGDAPIDADFSRNDRYLYVLDGGDDAISVYRVRADGSLETLQTVEGLPASVNGLAAL